MSEPEQDSADAQQRQRAQRLRQQISDLVSGSPPPPTKPESPASFVQRSMRELKSGPPKTDEHQTD